MDVPLFPLHAVLCPGIVVPLHIFEDRYRALTRRCLDSGEPFGVVLIRDGREVGDQSMVSLAAVGAFAEIREAGRYPDGRYDLLAAGTGRFAIESVDTGSEPYLVADVRPLEDEVGDEPRAERLAASAIRRFVRYLELMRARDGETTDELDIRVEVETPAAASLEGVGEDDGGKDHAGSGGAAGVDDTTQADAAARADAVHIGPDDRHVRPDDERPVQRTGPHGAPPLQPGTRRDAPAARDLVIPDDPTVLSHLLSGIVQVELPRRQALLEARTTVERLEGLIRLLDREVMLLSGRLRLFTPEPRTFGGARRS